MSDVQHLLHLETKAAEVLRATIQEIAGEDADLIRDSIEGETNLRELLAKTAQEIVTDGALVKGIGEAIKTMSERRDRIEKRIAMTRVAVLTAMQIAELMKLETPAGTLTRKAVPQSALILDEAAVPSQFFKPQDPKLDKKAVLDALKAGEIVTGCQLSNGGETIQLRT